MPPVTRVGDMASGHEAFPPTPVMQGSSNVFAGGASVCKKGDAILLHASGSPAPPHPRSAKSGSGTVKTNGQPTSRIGDDVDCGGMMMMGFGTVLIGG